MSTTLTTTSLGTSNLRGSFKQTRINPARTSRNVRPNLRQNSLVSNPASTSAQGAPVPEPHGFYPAITHFTDAITALPRDYRRNTSLLKEVDAKAWALEDNLQKLLEKCLHERQTRPDTSTTHTVAGSTVSAVGDAVLGSAADGANGSLLDTASVYSSASVDPDLLQKRRLYADLRNNLLQMIMPLDEKNHVINNANEELSRHTRRQDEIWPHIAEEISEEARLGSLRHWALTDLNPSKKAQANATRGRDAAVAMLPDKDIAERSERRREALLAKKQKTALQADSDIEARPTLRGKTISAAKMRQMEEDMTNGSHVGVGLGSLKQAKTRVNMAKTGDHTQVKGATNNQQSLGITSIAMSRENSQQGNSKKRKAPTAVTTVARKRYDQNQDKLSQTNTYPRINAATQESPKLAHSPLSGSFAKDTHKKSPALANARPVNGRGRQSSAQVGETSNRPASSASRRNGVTASASEIDRVAATTGKTAHEVKHTMKETINSKGEKMFEEDIPDSVDNRVRGGILLERTASKSSQLKREAQEETSSRRTASPRLSAAALVDTPKSERNGKGKGKNSTPVVSTFAEAESHESAAEATSNAENGNDAASKPKRLARPRMKDHHGLHDSLSPKGLPTKRTHKKNSSYSIAAVLSTGRNSKDEDVPIPERKPSSRANSRSTKYNSQNENNREGRNASSTPKIGGPLSELVDEPDSIQSSADTVQPSSRRQSSKPSQSNHTSTPLDLKPPPSSRTTISSATNNKMASMTRTDTASSTSHNNKQISPLGSPGPEEEPSVSTSPEPTPYNTTAYNNNSRTIDNSANLPLDDDDDEDPDEDRYCYCNQVSYGEMVACDNDGCAREWFHLECTGLRSLPASNSKWFCDECKGGRGK